MRAPKLMAVLAHRFDHGIGLGTTQTDRAVARMRLVHQLAYRLQSRLPLAPLLELGASPRATIALVRAARGQALLAGRDFVTPHDVKSLARDIMRHRILVSFEADAEGLTPDYILQQILDHIPVP